jgi:hypothetical protein
MHYYELFIIEICFPKSFIIHIVTFVYAREYCAQHEGLWRLLLPDEATCR